MSHILSQWINEQVGLSKDVAPTELDHVFRNGFYFGELLSRLKLEDQLNTDFKNTSTIDAAVKNFSSIERVLREKLGINLTTNEAINLITAKQGCAAKLLYQIKSAIVNNPQTTKEFLKISKTD